MKTSTHTLKVMKSPLAGSISAMVKTTLKMAGTTAKLKYPQSLPRRLNNWEAFLDEEDMLIGSDSAAGRVRW